MIKVILGDTNKIVGWISIDRSGGDYQVDFNKNSKLYMFDNNTVDCICSSHMIEHMSDDSVQNIINESFRVLKPGGILRICAPDAMYYINSYNTKEKKAFYVDEYGVGSGRTYRDEIAMFVNNIIPKHGIKVPAESLELHNLLCSMFCCYCDMPQYGPLFNKDLAEQKLKEGADKFIQWCASHYDLNRPAGHCNGFYSEKVMRMMKKAGFEKTFDMSFRNSHLEEIHTNKKIDLELRRNISFYAESIK